MSTTAAVTVGAVPIPFADALILHPIEIGQINGLARLYEVNKNEASKQFLNTIIEVGTVGVAAKTAISAVKAIPGLNIGASVLNAIIAGAIVAAIGQGSIYVFEKVYTGEKSIGDLDWVEKVMESNLSSQFLENVEAIIDQVIKSGNTKELGKLISSLIENMFNKKS